MKQIGRTEFMGEYVKEKLKYCGKGVIIYDLAKIINPQFAEIDDKTEIFDFVFIDAEKSLKIGKYCCITWQCIIEGKAHITIGDRCFLGPGSKLLSSTSEIHGYFSSQYLPDNCHKVNYGDIEIADDTYLGANCIVMPGITIGEGAVVGANSLVNKDLEPWSIYVGCPAKKIGLRKKPSNEMIQTINKMDWTKHF